MTGLVIAFCSCCAALFFLVLSEYGRLLSRRQESFNREIDPLLQPYRSAPPEN